MIVKNIINTQSLTFISYFPSSLFLSLPPLLPSLSLAVSSSLVSLTFPCCLFLPCFPHFLPLSLPLLLPSLSPAVSSFLTSLTFSCCLFLPLLPSLSPTVSSSLTFLPLSQQVSAALVYGRATHIVWPPYRLQRLSSSLSSDQHHRRNQGLSYQLI